MSWIMIIRHRQHSLSWSLFLGFFPPHSLHFHLILVVFISFQLNFAYSILDIPLLPSLLLLFPLVFLVIKISLVRDCRLYFFIRIVKSNLIQCAQSFWIILSRIAVIISGLSTSALYLLVLLIFSSSSFQHADSFRLIKVLLYFILVQ